MALVPRIIPNNWTSVQQAVAKLASLRLGINSTPTFAGLSLGDLTLSKICTVAAGLNVLRVTGLQTDATAMTGTLRGAYIDVSNGSTAATGTIRALELKARTEAPGDIGNDVAVLEGLSISADSKGHSVTTMRAAEFILDGSTGGTITEAVGLRIANNLQANKATTSYGLQIYRDSFDYTADIQLSSGGTIGGSSGDLKIASNGDVTLSRNLTTTGDGSFSDLTISSSGNAEGTASLSNSTVTTATTFTGLDLSYIKTAGGNVTGDFVGISVSLNYNENSTLSGNMNIASFSTTLTQGIMNDSVSIFKNIFTQNSGTLDANAYVFYNKATLTGGTADDDVIGGYFNISQGLGHTAINTLKVVEITGSALGTVSGTAYGLYIGTLTNFDYAIWDDSGKPWALDSDNQKILFGGDQDASIYYDGTDLVIDPKEVGTGSVNLNDGDLTTTGAGHFGDALDTDSTLVVDGTMAVGTIINAAYNLNVSSSGTAIARGLRARVIYTGTGAESYGVYCEAFGGGSYNSPATYGARFYGINYNITGQSGLASTYGGDFRAKDYPGRVYGTHGTGTYRFYCGYFYTANAAGDWTTNDPTVTTYRLYLTTTPTGFGDNHTDYAIYSAGGQSVHGGNFRIGSTTAPTVALDVTGDIKATGFLELTQKAGTTTDGDLWNDSTQEALQTFVSGIEQTLVGVTFTQTADQTIANTTTETTLFGTGVGTLTLPANFWVVGKTIRVEIHGDMADTGNPTAEVQAYYGATSLIDSGAITLAGLAGTEEWETEVIITCRSIGVTGTVETVIDWEYETTTGSSAIERLNVAGALQTIDTTASGALDVTFQWGTAAAANTIHSHTAFVEILN